MTMDYQKNMREDKIISEEYTEDAFEIRKDELIFSHGHFNNFYTIVNLNTDVFTKIVSTDSTFKMIPYPNYE